jgi:hypothetical protein
MSTMLRLCRVSDQKQNGAHLASHKRRAQFRPVVAAGVEHGLLTLDDFRRRAIARVTAPPVVCDLANQ